MFSHSLQILKDSLDTSCSYKEISALFDWALDSRLFAEPTMHASLNFVARTAMKLGEKYWGIQRGVVDRLFTQFIRTP